MRRRRRRLARLGPAQRPHMHGPWAASECGGRVLSFWLAERARRSSEKLRERSWTHGYDPGTPGCTKGTTRNCNDRAIQLSQGSSALCCTSCAALRPLHKRPPRRRRTWSASCERSRRPRPPSRGSKSSAPCRTGCSSPEDAMSITFNIRCRRMPPKQSPRAPSTCCTFRGSALRARATRLRRSWPCVSRSRSRDLWLVNLLAFLPLCPPLPLLTRCRC